MYSTSSSLRIVRGLVVRALCVPLHLRRLYLFRTDGASGVSDGPSVVVYENGERHLTERDEDGVVRPHPVYAHVNLDGLFFFQAEDGIRDLTVTGVQTCALPI